MCSGSLLYHQKANHFELNGVVLRPGMWIELSVVEYWICGQLNNDVTGWYVLISDQEGIPLQSGLIARFARLPSFLLSKQQPHGPQLPKGEDLKWILVVEDDETLASLLDEIFSQETPYSVYCASNGQAAWEILQDVQPNLIVLDYLLPGMNGLELHDRIRAHRVLQTIPVLMMSAALPSSEIKQRGLIGLQKPFEIDELLDTARNLMTST